MLTDLGALGGNNLVVLVASIAWAALVVDGVLGWKNLRGVWVERRLPDELYARTGCRGAFVVVRTGWWGAYGLDVSDGVASIGLERVPLGSRTQLAWWRFPDRGLVELGAIRISSSFPFGLFEHRIVQVEARQVLVYPYPGSGRRLRGHRGVEEGEMMTSQEGMGELRDLRPYQAGDRLRAIHWPTSARVGKPMVGVRSAEEDVGTVITLPPGANEAALEGVVGAVLEAWELGRAVGVVGLAPELATPRRGLRWRRRLLESLALSGIAP